MVVVAVARVRATRGDEHGFGAEIAVGGVLAPAVGGE